MIPTILNKILIELNSETPRLDYIRGMVEVLIASEKPMSLIVDLPKTFADVGYGGSINHNVTIPSSKDPEAQIMDAKTRALLESVKNGMTQE